MESLEIIEEHLRNSPDGLGNITVYDAVLRRVHTLSESACKLPEDIKQNHPSVEWQRFHRTRNIVVHDYLGDREPEDISYFIREHLPRLQSAMEQQLPEWKALRSRMQDA